MNKVFTTTTYLSLVLLSFPCLAQHRPVRPALVPMAVPRAPQVSQPALASWPVFTDLTLALKHPRQMYRLALQNAASLTSLRKFTQLRELDLSDNRLTTFPAEMGKIKKLEMFHFQPDHLTSEAKSLLRT